MPPSVRTFVRTEIALRVHECTCSLWAQPRANARAQVVLPAGLMLTIRMHKLMWVNAVNAQQCACASLSAICGLNADLYTCASRYATRGLN